MIFYDFSHLRKNTCASLLKSNWSWMYAIVSRSSFGFQAQNKANQNPYWRNLRHFVCQLNFHRSRETVDNKLSLVVYTVEKESPFFIKSLLERTRARIRHLKKELFGLRKVRRSSNNWQREKHFFWIIIRGKTLHQRPALEKKFNTTQ